MKTIRHTGILIISILLSASLRAQDTTKGQLTVALSDPGKPYKLDVDVLTGSINVIGYEGKDVQIEAQGNMKRHHSEDMGNGMKRISGGGTLDIDADEKNNVVTVNAGANNTPVNLIIKIPQNNATLKLSTVNDGNLTVTNVSGDMEVNNTNGSIKMANVSGSVVANTTNGSVMVTFKSIDPKAAMAFTTLNGNVEVTFPPGLKANIKLKTDNGDVYTDFDIVPDHHKPMITHTAKDGMYSLKMDDWVYGKIDGGGPELMMNTMNGSIYIRKIK